MKPSLKKLEDQVLFITGASSGIGLTTAHAAAKRGARVFLVARNEEALREAAKRLGPDAAYAVADVADEQQLEKAAKKCVDRFGTIDTWINGAGVSIFGRADTIPIEEQRRLFDTNFWGVVYGSFIAARMLKKKGGAIINLGSITSDRAIPLQVMYSASKQAIKGFTDGLRMELEEEGCPISVTLIKPASINTPFPKHARNYLGVEPTLPPPVYAPDVVADTILHAAEHPIRDVVVGGGGRALTAMHRLAPRLMDAVMRKFGFTGQRTAEVAPQDRQDALYVAGTGGSERGAYTGKTLEGSVYTKIAMHPFLAGAMLACGALGTRLLLKGWSLARRSAAHPARAG